MIRKLTLSVLMLFVLHSVAQAQACGEDIVKQRIKAADPSYNRKFADYASQWASWERAHSSAGARTVLAGGTGPQVVYEIPVVVHVIYPGSTYATPSVSNIYNPTEAQIDTMIAYLNRVYSATWASFPDSSSGGTYLPIQFVLAKRDSACNSTSGITRTDGSSVTGYTTGGMNLTKTTGASEVAVKDLNRWPIDEYMNIWVVSKIDSTDGYSATSSYVAGFAYVPSGATGGNPASLDGVVMLAQQARSTSNVTLPHELGHSMGLYHTFQDGSVSSCPPSGPCATTGDLVCDTEPEKQSNFNCPSDPNPCSVSGLYNNTQHNIMDYSSCQDRFTHGQRDRLIFTLLNSAYAAGYNRPRTGLIGSLGAVAPSALTALSSSCSPTISNPSNTLNAGVTEFRITDTAANTYGYVNTYLDFESDGYNGDGNKAFIDRTCREGATLLAGSTYQFMVQTGDVTAGEKARVYIDYNNDGTFDNTELAMSVDGTSANQQLKASVTLPTVVTRTSLVTCTPLRMRVISERGTVSTINPCGPLSYGQAEDYMVIIKGNGPVAGGVTIKLPAGSNPSCSADTLRFRSTLASGITAATYKWYVNGTYNGTTTDSFITNSIANGSTVYVKAFFAGACGSDSAVSNTITVVRSATVTPVASIALTTGNNPGCAGQSTTFTVTPTYGGSAPTYQWQVNGFNVGTSSTTYTGTLSAGDIVTCIMTSNSGCASPKTVTSNAITIYHYHLVAAISINATMPACQGKPVVFSSTLTNTGISPSFQWYVNGVPQSGATGTSYVTSSLSTGDVVSCVMTAPDSCIINHTVTSNSITVTLNPSQTPTVTATHTLGNNPGCLDSLQGCTGSATNIGSSPEYVWLV
ncbi:MAG: M43 family zinc metalloprotease, partial [Flavipsychrobacter sp.]